MACNIERLGRWLRLVASACLVIATAAGIAFAQDDSNVIESFDVAKDRSDRLLPVWFEGHKYLFILDTGSSSNIVDSRLERALVSTGERARINRNGEFAVYRSPELLLGKTKLPIEGRAIMADLANVRRAVGCDIHGILGMQFLGRHIVQIDYDAGKVALLKTSKGIGGQRVPIYCTRDERPAVTLELPVVGNTDFLIDTGMIVRHNGTLKAALFDELASVCQLSVGAVTSRMQTWEGDVITSRIGVLTSQTFHGNRHSTQEFARGDLNVLGIGYLSRYNLTFDFRHRVMILEKGKRYGWSSPATNTGFDISVVDGAPFVRDVDMDSAAWKGGIREGDQIVGIDDDDARQMKIYEIIARIETSETDLRISVSDSAGGNIRRVNLSQRR